MYFEMIFSIGIKKILSSILYSKNLGRLIGIWINEIFFFFEESFVFVTTPKTKFIGSVFSTDQAEVEPGKYKPNKNVNIKYSA